MYFAKSGDVLAQSAPDTVLRLFSRLHRGRVVDVRGELGVLDHLREQQGPRARYHLVDRVSAAAQRKPAPLAQLVGELVEDPADVRPDACGCRKVRQGIEVMRVAAVLG